MQIKQQETEFIKKSFERLASKDDFLELLNYTKKLIYGKKTVPFELKHLTYHSNAKLNTQRYTSFSVKKKSGGTRIINSPSKGLKAVQSCLNIIFQAVYTTNPSAYGFVVGKSVVDNAKIHTGNIYVYNIDLKDFFTSVDQARIWGRLQHPPFNLKNKPGKILINNMISAICCHYMEVERKNHQNKTIKLLKNVLPQGAPTSPVLTNIICQQLDFYLSAMARRFGVKYSRYADDITFSSMHHVYHEDGEFIKELRRIIKEQNFEINEKKTRLQKDDYRQVVTGIVVNKHPNVPKRYLDQLRRWIYYWESYGYKKATEIFLKNYKKDKGYKSKSIPNLQSVLAGKLDYLKMVKGSDDSVYLGYRKRFQKLADRQPVVPLIIKKVNPDLHIKHLPIETVKFLKFFKYDNQFSFKGLVHHPINLDDFNFDSLLLKARNEFYSLSVTEDEKINLPKTLVESAQVFFDKLKELGSPFFKRTGDHPLNDRATGFLIQQFKGNYRFGNERSESSILSELILNTAKKRTIPDHRNEVVFSFGEKDTSTLFNIEQLNFIPDTLKFQYKANFFTWVPNVTMALSSIFDSILKHSNINAKRPFNYAEKRISIDLNRKLVGDIVKIELSITDLHSVFIGDLSKIMSDMRRDFFSTLAGICDFTVQFRSTDSINYQCQILPYAEKIEPIEEKVGGFKYILTFYD